MADNESLSDRSGGIPASGVRICLLVGMSASFALIGVGLALTIILRSFRVQPAPVHSLWAGIIALDPNAVLALGLLVLVLSPLAGVLAATTVLALRRSRDAVFGVLVLLVIAVGYALAFR